MIELQQLEKIPQGLLECEATELADFLGAPTLLHLKGVREPALFVTILLHGNETTGWEAMRRLLRQYQAGGGEHPLPRNLSIFFGNLSAAKAGLRKLERQPDFNRVWEGGDTVEAGLMQRVLMVMDERGMFASIDIHNNTGINPHYACINVIDPQFLRLALLFSRLVIYFIRPRGVQSMALASRCPAVTLECGKVGDQLGVDHAIEYVNSVLHLKELDSEPLRHEEVDLYHTVATVKVPESISFAFGDKSKELSLSPGLERFNFSEINASTTWGDVFGDDLPLEVTDEQGGDVSEHYFCVDDGRIVNRVTIMPSMLTMNERVIRQDCLCYLMERYSLPQELLA